MLPALSQKLLVAQSVTADPAQPGLAAIDGMSGVQFVQPGVAVVSCEKLGLLMSTHYVNWAPGVQQGAVAIEVADEPAYTGPWLQVALVDFVNGITVTPIATANPGSGQAPRLDAVIVNSGFGAMRHRIVTPVVGGSVTTKVVGTCTS